MTFPFESKEEEGHIKSFSSSFSKVYLALRAEVASMNMTTMFSSVAVPGQTCQGTHRHLQIQLLHGNFLNDQLFEVFFIWLATEQILP